MHILKIVLIIIIKINTKCKLKMGKIVVYDLLIHVDGHCTHRYTIIVPVYMINKC